MSGEDELVDPIGVRGGEDRRDRAAERLLTTLARAIPSASITAPTCVDHSASH
jgi:hypothetical protein